MNEYGLGNNLEYVVFSLIGKCGDTASRPKKFTNILLTLYFNMSEAVLVILPDS